MLPHISGHLLSGLEVVCFLVSLSPDHVHPSSGLSVNKINLVKPVHASDNSLFSINNTPSDVCVVLVASMYFSGIGNDSSLGMESLTLGST